jgi:hypothetical protein
MDLDTIKSSVLNQLTDINGLYSLKIQNHIYGCFLIMEDIAQGNVDLKDNIISTSKFSLDLNNQFGEIGLRYGFVMDTKLSLDTYNQEYKDIWLHYFNIIGNNKNIDEVDTIEDCLIEVIQTSVKSDDAFFINALDTGSLPQEWLEKAIRLISEPVALPKSDSEEDLKKSALSHAITEKPIRVKHKRLSVTRRANVKVTPTIKKSLAKTRRH